MLRTVGMTIGLAGIWLVGPATGQEPPKATSSPEMVPDPNWKPKPGDRVTVHAIDAPSVSVLPNFDPMVKFIAANDQTGLKDLGDRKVMVLIPAGTHVLVLQAHGLPKPSSGPMVTTAENFHREVQESILRSAGQPKRHIAVEVRVLDGPLKDKVRFVDMESLATLIPKPHAAPAIVVGGKYFTTKSGADASSSWLPFQGQSVPGKISTRKDVLFSLAPGTKIIILQYEDNPMHCVKIRVLPGQKNAGKVGVIRDICLTDQDPIAK